MKTSWVGQFGWIRSGEVVWEEEKRDEKWFSPRYVRTVSFPQICVMRRHSRDTLMTDWVENKQSLRRGLLTRRDGVIVVEPLEGREGEPTLSWNNGRGVERVARR